MCGIFGYYLKDTKINESLKKNSIKCLSLLNHRGPDNHDFWINEQNNFFLGHTRLSILDTSSNANQPLVNKQKALSYNGEIYNYKELKGELEKDFTFSSTSDTEVLFNFLLKNKINKIEKLDGMFAFAYYDEGELYLCNDMFGEKPIYYLQNEKGFFFSSEINCLKNFLNTKKDSSISKKNKFMMFGFLREDTFFKKIKYFGPATIIKIYKGEIKQKIQYWNYDQFLTSKDKKKIIEKKDIKEIKNLLVTSCEMKLNSDQPISLLLSSGIDSTLLASIYQKEINISLQNFHASFENLDNFNSKFNETNLTTKIAEELDLNLTIEKIDFDEKLFSFKNLLKIFNEPNDNISSLLTHKIFETISKNYKVAISGLGADEIFYGYNGYKFFSNNLKYIQSSFIKKLLNFLNYVNFKKLKTLKYYSKYNNLDLIFSHFNFNYFDDIKTKDFDDIVFDTKYSLIENYSSIRFKSTLPFQMLAASDRSSMRNSLEVRSPYLNKNLLLKTLEYDPVTLINKGHKYIQTEILKEYLPKNLINQKKIGFILNPKIFIKNSFDRNSHFNRKDFIFNRFNLRNLMYKQFFLNEN